MIVVDKIHSYLERDRAWYQRDVEDVEVITVHHTASPKLYDDFLELDHIYSAHVKNGWPGAAYHFVITSSGNIYQLNDLTDVTWHDTRNWDSIGVCMVGYFHPDINEQPSEKQLNALRWLLDALCESHPEFPASHGDVVGHRERASTACPGNNLFPKVVEYREKGGEVEWGGEGDFHKPVEGGEVDDEEKNRRNAHYFDLTWLDEFPEIGTQNLDAKVVDSWRKTLEERREMSKKITAALGLDETAPLDTVLRSIAGLKGLDSRLQTIDAELKNKEAQVSRLKDQLTETEKLWKERVDALTATVENLTTAKPVEQKTIVKLQEQVDDYAASLGECRIDLSKAQKGTLDWKYHVKSLWKLLLDETK